jgi:hypothetical protein
MTDGQCPSTGAELVCMSMTAGMHRRPPRTGSACITLRRRRPLDRLTHGRRPAMVGVAQEETNGMHNRTSTHRVDEVETMPGAG